MRRKTNHQSYTRHELHTLATWARRTKVACELIPPTAATIMLIHCVLLYFDIRLPVETKGFIRFIAPRYGKSNLDLRVTTIAKCFPKICNSSLSNTTY